MKLTCTYIQPPEGISFIAGQPTTLSLLLTAIAEEALLLDDGFSPSSEYTGSPISSPPWRTKLAHKQILEAGLRLRC
jgi:hypothetical protein